MSTAWLRIDLLPADATRLMTVQPHPPRIVSVYLILDLEYPRRGLIRLDAADQMLVDLRASMG